jgi:hypothetical protein
LTPLSAKSISLDSPFKEPNDINDNLSLLTGVVTAVKDNNTAAIKQNRTTCLDKSANTLLHGKQVT